MTGNWQQPQLGNKGMEGPGKPDNIQSRKVKKIGLDA
jgi:hypothetical protein